MKWLQRVILNGLYQVFFRTFLKAIIGVRFVGVEKLAKLNQYIICANHTSHIDTICLLAALPAKQIQQVHPIAKREYFGRNRLTEFLTRFLVNAELIYCNRLPKQQKSSFVVMDRMLKRGQSIILFPEGGRGDPNKQANFKKGIGLLLKKNPKVPCIPVYLQNMANVLPKGSLLILPYLAWVYIGDPIIIDPEMEVEQITALVEHSVHQLNVGEGKGH